MACNGKVLTRVLKVMEMMVKFLMEYRAAKKFPAKGKQFPLLLPSTTLTIFATYCEFSLSIARDMGPFLTLFEAKQPLVVFLRKHLMIWYWQ